MQKEKYQILEAVNGLECLKTYQAHQPDLVLLDAVMPIMDGFSCCQKLVELQIQQSQDPNCYKIPILMITGLNDQKSVNRAFEVGAIDYITKPIQHSVLRHRLRYLLEAKWAEAVIRENEQKYRLVVNSLQEGIFQLDTKGIITFVNLAWSNLLGFSQEESLNKPLSEFIYTPDITTYESALKSLLNQKETKFRLSIRYVKKNQEVGWMEIYACPILTENNFGDSKKRQQNIMGISGTVNDITESQLRQSYQQVEYQINKVLVDTKEIEVTIAKIISIFCSNLNWDLGEYWLLDPIDHSLILKTFWYSDQDDLKDKLHNFVQHSNQLHLTTKNSFPGKIWTEKTVLLLNNITENDNFARTEIFKEANLNTGCGFLISTGSDKLGVICCFGHERKQIDSYFFNLIRNIGNYIGQFIKRYEAEAELQRQHRILKSELNQAAQYVSSLLPKSDSIQTIDIQQLFIPSIQLGGDIFDYYWLDSQNLVIYLLDVAGHGVRPALLSVSVLNILRSQSLYNTDFYQPWSVITELNRTFPMDEKGENYFTIWYGVYNVQERKLSYCSAAHPPALLLNPNSQDFTLQQLANDNIAVGMLPEFEFEQASCLVAPGSSLYIFSDGIYEIPIDADQFWGFQAFADYIQDNHPDKIENINSILNHIQQLNSAKTLGDDVSLIRLKFF